MVIETDRLLLRPMGWEDLDGLSKILKDPDAMTAYEGAFSDEEVKAWLEKQLVRYREYGHGLQAVILKQTGEMIGQWG